jgi:hypothetical protein
MEKTKEEELLSRLSVQQKISLYIRRTHFFSQDEGNAESGRRTSQG